MLVPAMNLDEIAAQVKSEYDKIFNTALVRLGAEYSRERKKLQISKEEAYPKEYEIKTAGKNNWIIFMHKAPGVKKYNGTENICFLCIVYYYSKKGLVAYYPAAHDVLAGFTSHFFKRYNERLGLHLSKPVDIVKAFFRKGMYSNGKIVEKNNKHHIIGFGVDGIRLGEVKFMSNYSYVEFKTFVTRKLAFSAQKKLERELFESLVDELESAEENQCGRDELREFKNRLAVLPVVSKIKKSKPAPAFIPEIKDLPVLAGNYDGFLPQAPGTGRIFPERLFAHSYK